MFTSPFDLTDRHILVTGATGGIGRVTAAMLAQLGARVTATGRNPARLEETVRSLGGATGHRASVFDLSDSAAIPAWLKSETAAAGPFNGIVHCAGIQITRPVRQVNPLDFDEIMRVNLLSALMLARGYRQKGCHLEHGALVFISSLAAKVGLPSNIVYSASKGGLEAAVRGLAVELYRDGIRVNAVAPGSIRTEMLDRFIDIISDDQLQAFRSSQPMGFGEPEDVAPVIAFLLSDAARWINGAVLPVDGGVHAT